MTKCPKCKSIVDDDSEFCKSCGTPIEINRICQRCNSVNDSDSKYCKSCGSSIKSKTISNPFLRRIKNNFKKIGIVLIIFIIIFSIIGYSLVSPGIEVIVYTALPATDENAPICVMFWIEMENSNLFMDKTQTVWCEVHTDAGNTYTGHREFTLDPGENRILKYDPIQVNAPTDEILDGYETNVFVK